MSSANAWSRCPGWRGCGTPCARSPTATTASTWWAVPCATSCSASRRSTSTSRSRATASRSPAHWPRGWTAGCTCTRSSARRWCWRAGSGWTSPPRAPSTTSGRRRCPWSSTPRSSATCTGATSPSTPWRWTCRPKGSAGWSTRSAAPRTWRPAACACSTTCRSSRTRPGSSGRFGTRTATASRWSPRPASWPGRASRWGWSARSRAPACATSWSRSCPRAGSAAPCAGCASSGWMPRCIRRWTAGSRRPR